MPELYFQDYPGPADRPPLALLHGLFGASANWRGVAKRLCEDRRILVMDMRNHGRSFHARTMTYPQMAQDILDTLAAQGIERADLLGHSMGGKAAMVAALEQPERVGHLVVVDIAPVIYTHTHMPLIEAMMKLHVERLQSRAEAEEMLAGDIEDRTVRQFLLQNLEKAQDGYRWRLNLDALKYGMEELVDFPDLDGRTFDGPTLFLYGADSDYVQAEQRPRIERYFPKAEYAAVENAGHWVHADQPGSLIRQVAAFLAE